MLPGRPRQVDIVPFGNRLADLARRLHATHRALVVAYGAGKSFQVFLPTQDPGTERLVQEFRQSVWVSGGSTVTWSCEILGSSSGSSLVGAAARLVLALSS